MSSCNYRIRWRDDYCSHDDQQCPLGSSSPGQSPNPPFPAKIRSLQMTKIGLVLGPSGRTSESQDEGTGSSRARTDADTIKIHQRYENFQKGQRTNMALGAIIGELTQSSGPTVSLNMMNIGQERRVFVSTCEPKTPLCKECKGYTSGDDGCEDTNNLRSDKLVFES